MRSRGYRGVDVRGRRGYIDMTEEEFVHHVEKNTHFKVYNRAKPGEPPRYRYADGHYHLTCNSQKCIDFEAGSGGG